mmetsp:Transcript_71517/g.165375  ORF Transcript_71517/g.165375 Transcript_71517/m.165375 type:complete len:145 (+) Transcript_71517:227-661(+)
MCTSTGCRSAEDQDTSRGPQARRCEGQSQYSPLSTGGAAPCVTRAPTPHFNGNSTCEALSLAFRSASVCQPLLCSLLTPPQRTGNGMCPLARTKEATDKDFLVLDWDNRNSRGWNVEHAKFNGLLCMCCLRARARACERALVLA